MNTLKRIISAEPIITALVTNAAFWPAVFAVASAFGHPISDTQQHALIGLAAVISAVILRQNMSSPATVNTQLADIKSAQQKVGV